MTPVLPDPFYYLSNFQRVLTWVSTRHADLLLDDERARITCLAALPRPALALLVRLVMRKGELFRQTRLDYPEIGAVAAPMQVLANNGLVDPAPTLSLPELFGLLRKAELQALLSRLPGPQQDPGLARSLRALRKDALLELLQEHFPDAWPLAAWAPGGSEPVYRLLHSGFYDLLRLLFFGNLRQDWSEFVLTDLGLLKYELVEIPADARAFQSRADVDDYLQLHALRARLEAGDAPQEVLADVPGLQGRSGFSPTATTAMTADDCIGLTPNLRPQEVPFWGRPQEVPFWGRPQEVPFWGRPQGVLAGGAEVHFANAWLEERRARLLFTIGQQLEREKNWSVALAAYQASRWPEARIRAIRVLEQDAQPALALDLAVSVLQSAPREEERQQLARMLPRLRRKLGLAKEPAEPLLAPNRRDLVLDFDADVSVEVRVRDHLHDEAAPVFYVENALINSLFGLLCWPAIFAPVPGAFFHAFHYGPVDLHSPDFAARREAEFAQCLGLLDSDAYRAAILSTWQAKYGIQSPFVFWDWLDEDLLTLALDCIPATHLKALFTRLLADIKNNRSGFPDLIQFWPAEKRYLMLEVKGPGDRLQDNQARWLDYCVRHGIPVAVSHVTWAEEA